MQSLLDLCEGSEIEPGAWVGMRCWEQAIINLVGAREAATAAAGKYGEKSDGRGVKEDSRDGVTVTIKSIKFD